MTNELMLVPEIPIMDLGNVLAKSGYFQDARDAAQAIVKVLAGRELGFGPIASMTGFYIVKGRVSMSANLMGAAVKRSGRYNYRVLTSHDKRSRECEIAFYEGKDEIGRSLFTLEDAKRANLNGDNWTKYPSNMLFARAMSNGVKWYCPDVTGGPVYTPDELGEVVDGETGEIVKQDKGPSLGNIEPYSADHTGGNGKTTDRQAQQQPAQQAPTPDDGAKQAALKYQPFVTWANQWAQGNGKQYARENDANLVNMHHLLNRIGALGFSQVTEQNADDIKAALESYVKGKVDAGTGAM